MRLGQVVPNHIVTQWPFVMKIKMNLKFCFHLEKLWLGSTLIDRKWISFNSHKLHKTFNASLFCLLKPIVQLFKNLLILNSKSSKFIQCKANKTLISSKYSVKSINLEESKISYFLNLNPNLWYVFYYKKCAHLADPHNKLLFIDTSRNKPLA